MGERETRVAHIEALFRDVNERIAETAKRFKATEAGFVCECADSECVERVPATLAAYEDVRSDGTHFCSCRATRTRRSSASSRGRIAASQ